MMFPTRNTLCLSALLGTGALFSSLAACTSEDDTDPQKSTGGASGTTGGTTGTGTGGTSATGGTGGGNTTGSPNAKACPPPASSLLTDFTYVGGEGAKTDVATFGTFSGDLSGGTYVFPGGTEMYPLTSDVTGDNWNIKGPIGNYSGAGLFLQDCQKVDASAFKGIRFTISGNIAMGGTMTLQVGTADNDVAAAWLNANGSIGEEGFGRCIPASNRYDGSCSAGSKVIPVTATPTEVRILWSELTGGKPQPQLNPAEITYITWVFPNPTGVGSEAVVTYEADVTIDDLGFIE